MRVRSPLVLIAVTLPLTACGGSADSSSEPSVVAGSYPFAYVAERVGGDAVSVENLTPAGSEPHDVELAPKQVAKVQDADLAVFQTGFQPAVDDAVTEADLSDEAALDVTDAVELLHHPGSGGHDHDHDEEAGPGEGDPHVWLDPTNMVAITEAVTDRLKEVSPDDADTFEKNARELTAGLRKLDRSFKQGLANCTRTTIVTSHEAFGYLADRYGLQEVPVAGIEPGNEPEPAELADIAGIARQEGVTTVFTEKLVSPAVAETVAEEIGADVARLDPVEGLDDDTADESYISLMRQNLAALQKANGCS